MIVAQTKQSQFESCVKRTWPPIWRPRAGSNFPSTTLAVDVLVKMLLRAFERVTTWWMSTSWPISVEVPSTLSGWSKHLSLATTLRGCVQLLARYIKARIGAQLRLASRHHTSSPKPAVRPGTSSLVFTVIQSTGARADLRDNY